MHTIEQGDYTFNVIIEPDYDHSPPWKENDCHGPVRTGKKESKYPGERILYENYGWCHFYDWQEAVKIAKCEGWGDDGKTRGERAHNAVERDFEYLRSWCRNEWQYVGVIVELALDNEDAEDFRNETTQSLWGIESIDGFYISSVARDLAAQITSGWETDVKLTPNQIRWLAMIATKSFDDNMSMPDWVCSGATYEQRHYMFGRCYEHREKSAGRKLLEAGWAALKEADNEVDAA